MPVRLELVVVAGAAWTGEVVRLPVIFVGPSARRCQVGDLREALGAGGDGSVALVPLPDHAHNQLAWARRRPEEAQQGRRQVGIPVRHNGHIDGVIIARRHPQA